MTKKRILNTDELKRLVKSVDSDWEVGLYLLGYILNNVARINAFLNEHDLNKKFFYPIANIFALVNIPEKDRKELQKHKDLSLKSMCIKQSRTLIGIKTDKEIQQIFKIDEKQIDALLKRDQEISNLPFPIRYNDKTVIKKKLRIAVFMFEEKGLAQTIQINIISDLFEQEGFEDYKQGSSPERIDRIRKTYQEPALKDYKKAHARKIRTLIPPPSIP
jgi:hypothetical protein